MYELLLVSQSPRRQQLLQEAGFLFRVDSVKVSETIKENVNITGAIELLAQTKGRAYANKHKSLKGKEILILSADTMVVLGESALGKPKNPAEATQFLRQLSGKTPRVITGIYLLNLATGDEILASDTTKVEFFHLSDQEISDYIATEEPMDKAGAYAIQGLGGKFVKNIIGSRSNVIGLPMELFEKVLAESQWHVTRRLKFSDFETGLTINFSDISLFDLLQFFYFSFSSIFSLTCIMSQRSPFPLLLPTSGIFLLSQFAVSISN